MSDRDGTRMTGDDALGRQIKANLRGLDSFIPPAPSLAEIESPALRPLGLRGRSGPRARLNLRAAPGLLVAGLVVVIVLGSGVWRPSHSAGAVDSPAASEASSNAASPSDESETSLEATAAPTNTPELSPAAVASFGGEATAESPWYAAEVSMLDLINCTRTGGWVTADGICGSESHHTLPAQAPLVLDAGISDKVARPYAKYLADNSVLSHFLGGTTPQSRLCSAGYCGATWGENLASPHTPDRDGMISIETFYQNEYWCSCEHYANIMAPQFHRVGIGVWESSGLVRVVVNFYE